MEGKLQSAYNLEGKMNYLPQLDSTLTKEGHAADAKAVGDRIAKAMEPVLPADNLLSTSVTLPLSANQGRVLDEKIAAWNEKWEETAKKSELPTFSLNGTTLTITL